MNSSRDWTMRKDWRKATLSGDVEAIGQLLADGVDVDSRDRYGQTALMLASTYGQPDVVRHLLAHGADRNVTAKYGLSALMLAIINHHTEIAEQLVDAGADVTLSGTGGGTGFFGRSARDFADERGLTALAEKLDQAMDNAAGKC